VVKKANGLAGGAEKNGGEKGYGLGKARGFLYFCCSLLNFTYGKY
jgi:hypothetical protein